MAPTHSSKRQAGQGQVHEAVVPTEAPAAGLGQDPLHHLRGSSGEAGEGAARAPGLYLTLLGIPRLYLAPSAHRGPWQGLRPPCELKTSLPPPHPH